MLTQKNDQNEVCIVERRRLRGIFLETLELNDFPLDVQDLTITLTSERPDSEVILVPDRSELCGINLQTLVDQQEWKLHEHIEVKRRSATQEYTNSSQSHPCISVTCRAARRPGYFYWNVFLIMFFITGLSFATFAVPPERPENRLQLSFTLFLTSVAFKFVINQSLPKISYLTYMDKYVLMSLAILCVVSIWHAMVTLIPTDVVFEQEDVMNVLKFSSLDSASLSLLEDNETLSTTVFREANQSQFGPTSLPNTTPSPTARSKLLRKDRTPIIIVTTVPPKPTDLTLTNITTSIPPDKSNWLPMWDAEQWKKFAQQSTDMEQEKRMLKLRIERDVFASFCVLYGLAHLTFAFWLYFDASKRRREMVERDRQYKFLYYFIKFVKSAVFKLLKQPNEYPEQNIKSVGPWIVPYSTPFILSWPQSKFHRNISARDIVAHTKIPLILGELGAFCSPLFGISFPPLPRRLSPSHPQEAPLLCLLFSRVS
ncbi:Gamma-aminobutyric acid receptor subunit gamma-2 [Fasciola gigantica]|uniref:Gamma-aminobutyric acid receptor subunit gamma-2 n=1 Tax=Fasciola gigantica TaxID=46835 RepID=A0A504YJA0_FASGI|nr:Gamma-aminobutyric acid receptor subunit gamma-2 [Fasciola gigantica]